MENTKTVRRFALFPVTPHCLLQLYKNPRAQTVQVVAGLLPEDAELICTHYDADKDLVYLRLESAAFDVVEPGAQIPVIDSTTVRVVSANYDRE